VLAGKEAAMINAHCSIFRFMVLGLAAAAASPALAGEIGATSRAALTISASVAPRFEIRDTGSQPDQSISSAWSLSRGICISANTPTRMYSLTLLSLGAQSARSSSPDPGSRPLSLQWTSLERPGERADVSPGATAGEFLASGEACGAANIANAKLSINLAHSSDGAWAAPEFATLIIIPE
jgi:hypothetical protein